VSLLRYSGKHVSSGSFCNHIEHEQTICKKYDVNGNVMYRALCSRCGYAGGSNIDHKYVYDTYELDLIPVYDERSMDEYRENWKRAKDAERAAWRSRYNNYLLSWEWRSKREGILRRDRFICRVCSRNRAVQVHHLTYVRVFNENDADLISICKSCHDNQHGKES